MLAALSVSTSASAADTIETWDAGAADLELYLSYEGLGAPPADRTAAHDFVLGYGIIPRFSTYLSATLITSESFTSGAGLALGVFGTPLDTGAVDVDILLEVSAAGDGLDELTFAPGLELTIDATPDRTSWGGYLRVAAPVQGVPSLGATPEGATLAIELTGGMYAMAAQGQELLAEIEVALRPMARADEPQAEVDSLALGYNVQVSDAIELIGQLSATPPTAASSFDAGASLGFIATLGPADSRPQTSVETSSARP